MPFSGPGIRSVLCGGPDVGIKPGFGFLRLRAMVFRSRSPALWCFRAALEALDEAHADCAVADDLASEPGRRSGDMRRSQRVGDTLIEMLSRAGAAAPRSRLSQLHEAYGAAAPQSSRDTTTTFDEIVERLRKEPAPSRRELRRLRRHFARYNHPDRVPPDMKAKALRQMATINAMIDNALRKPAS